MTIKEFISLRYRKKDTKIEEAYADTLGTSIAYKKLAIESCISLISNTLASAEFQTFENGTKTKNTNYYAFNIEPNVNQNSSEFFRELVSKLIKDNEVLVVLIDGQYFIVDSFEQVENGLSENIYTDIVIREKQIAQSFTEKEVLYFKFNDENISNIIDDLYGDYSKLLSCSMNHFRKSKGQKGVLKISTMMSQRNDYQEKLKELMEKKFKPYFNADTAVLPLQDGYEWNEKTSTVKGDSRDIKHLVNDIFDFVGSGFHVPTGLLRGDIAGLGDQIDSFIMFRIKPLADLIQTEMNRKIYSKEEYLKRSYIKIDLTKIKLVDIQKLATTSDLLLRNGTHSIDDNLEMLGLEPKNVAWSMQHYMTKNYQSVLGEDNLIEDKTKKNNLIKEKKEIA